MELVEFQDKVEQEIKKASEMDKGIQDIKKALENGEKEIKGVALGLCQWWAGSFRYQGKIWIPEKEPLRTAQIYHHHEVPQAGHWGTAKTMELITRKYDWAKMNDTIKRYVKNCDIWEPTKMIRRHAP